MPVNPAAIIGAYPAFCASADENTTIDDAAAEIAQEIVNYFKPAAVTITQAQCSEFDKGAIEDALAGDMKALEAKESTIILPTDFMPTATAIVAEIQGLTLGGALAMPPIPPMTQPGPTPGVPAATGFGYSILFAGVPLTLATGIASAMSQLTPILTANILVASLTSHLATVSGLYTGYWPNPAVATTGIPFVPFSPLPWVGIS